MSLSPRAEAALLRCVYLGTKPTVEALREAYKGTGRDMWLTTLKELKAAGFVAEKTYRVGQRFETVVWVTEAGTDYLKGSGFPTLQPYSVEVGFSDPLFSKDKLHSPYSKASLTSKEYTRENPRDEYFKKINLEVDDMSSWGGMFESTASDERLEERARAQREKKAEYQEAKAEKHGKKIIRRQDVDPKVWTSSDVAYEFSHRISMTWGLKEWSPNFKRMTGSFHTLRMKHETDGEIELRMLNLFFSAIDFEKYNDPDMLWKIFSNRWVEFANQARGMVRTDEEVDLAKSQAKKSQEWLYE